MKSHKLMKNPMISGKCVLVLIILIFCLTMSTFVLIETRKQQNDNSTVLRILMNTESEENPNATKFLLINLDQKADLIDLMPAESLKSSDKIKRQAVNKTKTTSKGYYEEQQPVVVHAESSLPIINYQHSQNNVKNVESNENERQSSYYANDDNVNDYFDENYYDDGGDSKQKYDVDEQETGRSDQQQQQQQQQQQYNSNQQWYYNPWPFASRNTAESNDANIQKGKQNQMEAEQRQPSYTSYTDEISDYEYPMGFVRRRPTNEPKNQLSNEEMQKQILQQSQARIPERQQMMQQRPQQNQQQHSTQQTAKPSNAIQPVDTESTLLSVIKGLKTMWDIYQAFSSAWNIIAEHRQKQEDTLREKLKQQKRTRIRVNSKKPPKFSSNSTVTATTTEKLTAIDDTDMDNKDKSPTKSDEQNNNTKSKTTTKPKIRSTKPPKPKSSTTTTPTAPTITNPTEITSFIASEKVEPRHGNSKGDRTMKRASTTLRERRASSGDAMDATSVGEGRYIKGDPLKGYYDFVITEGSYKFWAVFQTGTALLIIYSVFAAIYYSKVNPLVSDYDYTDYLGGARSLSGGDVDFVDDDGDNQKKGDNKKTTSSWFADVLPKAGHSLEFILNAIDKLPVDHDQAEQESNGYSETSDYDYATNMPS